MNMLRNLTGAPALLEHGAATLVQDYMAVAPGESVLITADTHTDGLALEAVFRAVQAARARPVLMLIPQLPYQGGLADPYVPPTMGGAVQASDVWIDLTFPYLAGSHIFEEAMAAGKVRYLLGADMGAGGIARMFGGIDLDQYFSVFGKLQDFVIASVGKQARVTDPLGTDVSFELDKPGIIKPRRADKPGTYLVPGSCGLHPVLESVQGTLCFTAIFHEYFSALSEPLVLKVDGKVREVNGPTIDRIVLDRALRRAGNGEYGHIIHFTYGMNPAARATGKSFIEDSRVMGSNAVGMGLPWWVPGGGENHPDGVISNQSVWIDGELIIKDGMLVGPADVARLAPDLQPNPDGPYSPTRPTQPAADANTAPSAATV